MCVLYNHHHNASLNAAYVTLLQATVIASLLRLLNGQVRQQQTNNHLQNICNTRLAHTHSSHSGSQSKEGIGTGVGGLGL